MNFADLILTLFNAYSVSTEFKKNLTSHYLNVMLSVGLIKKFLHVTCRSVHIACTVREDRMWLHSKDFRFVVFFFTSTDVWKTKLKVEVE